MPRPNVAEIGRSNPHSRFRDVRVGILTFNRCPYRAPFPIYPTLSSCPNSLSSRPEQIIAKR